MSLNPYAPPESQVTAVQPPWSPPKAVSRACWLILAALLIGIVSLLPGIRPVRPDEAEVGLGFTAGIVLVFGGITVWLAIEVWRGKPWARWAMLAYLALGWLLGGGALSEDFQRSPLAGSIEAACMAMELAACGLLFFGEGAKWFAAQAALRRERAGRV